MMMRKGLLAIVALLLGFTSFAQEEDKPEEDPANLVPNPSFEEYSDRLRRDEQFDLTEKWFNPTPVISDLYASGIKSRYVAVPENQYGYEMPYDGENYAGLVMYSFRNKMPRTYISVEFKSKLKENALYCVRYRASLAERSRFASNNLGASITSKKPSERSPISMSRPDAMLTSKNDVVTTTDGWWEFCHRYNAKGGERYLTIGNFMPDGRTTTRNMELPAKYAEDGAEPVAYYYIDAVEVVEVEANELCGCSNTKIPESKVIYSAGTVLADDMTLTEKIEAINAYFYQYRDDVVSVAKRDIDKIVDMMKANPMMRVRIIGHTDNEEAELAKNEPKLRDLARQRALKVMSYIESQGVDRKRLLIESVDNKQPASNRSTPLSLAQNRRVEFELAL